MRRRLSTLGAGLLIAGSLVPAMVLAPAPVLATAAVIDQRSESIPWEWQLTGDYAQTFTVGKTGTLTAISLWVFSNGHVTVELSIHPLNESGFPNGWPLSSGSSSAVTTDAFLWFSMSPPAYFTAGQHLAIVIHVVPNAPYKCDVRGSDANPYAGGMAQQFSSGAWRGFQLGTTTDFAFRTYMVVPTATPTPLPTLMPVPPATAPPPQVATVPPALDATPSFAPTATPTDTSTGAPVAVATPAGAESPAAASASGSGSAATGTFTPGGSAGSGGTNDVPLAAILAAIAALGMVFGGLAFLLLRRRRQAET